MLVGENVCKSDSRHGDSVEAFRLHISKTHDGEKKNPSINSEIPFNDRLQTERRKFLLRERLIPEAKGGAFWRGER